MRAVMSYGASPLRANPVVLNETTYGQADVLDPTDSIPSKSTYLDYRTLPIGATPAYNTYRDPRTLLQSKPLTNFSTTSVSNGLPLASPHSATSDETVSLYSGAVAEDRATIRAVSSTNSLSAGDDANQHNTPAGSFQDGSSAQLYPRIPTSNMDDPVTPEKVKVSTMGSVYISGTRARDVSRRQEAEEQATHEEPYLSLEVRPHTATTQSSDKPDESIFPSDQRSVSQRVRSLYEDDADIGYRARPASALSSRLHDNGDGQGSRAQGVRSPDYDVVATGALPLPRSTSVLSNRSRTSRTPGEVAGGAEDWTDVTSSDVDRYGFIRNKSIRSGHSTAGAGSNQESASRGRPYTPLPAIDEASPPFSDWKRRPSTQGAAHATESRNKRSFQSDRSPRSRNTTFDFLRSPRRRQKHLLAEADRILANSKSSEEFSISDPARAKLEAARADKWQAMIAKSSPTPRISGLGGGTTFMFNPSDPKVISRAWKGIPDRWRATAWHSFLTASASRNSLTRRPSPSDSDLIARFHELQEIDYAEDSQIDIDMPRTVGQHVMFRKRYHGGQRFLFRVCHALALYFPDTGYVQGMGAIVATLICYFEEERAFVAAVRMWQHRGVGWLYKNGFDGLMESLKDLETKWMSVGDGGVLKRRLDDVGVIHEIWGTKWYLTLFNYILPFQAQLRVWDVFMLLGDTPSLPLPVVKSPEMRQVKSVQEQQTGTMFPKPNLDVLHAVTVALLLAQRESLAKADFGEAMETLSAMVPVHGESAEDSLMLVAKDLMAEAEKSVQKGR